MIIPDVFEKTVLVEPDYGVGATLVKHPRRPDRGWVEMNVNIDYEADVNLHFSPDKARALAKALNDMADQIETGTFMRKSAKIEGTNRYHLVRYWGSENLYEERRLGLIMLNPSTADAEIDDATIRCCLRLALREGLDGITVVNLFAHRSPSPKDLLAALLDGSYEAAMQDRNASHIAAVLNSAARLGTPVVAAWGAHPTSWRKTQAGVEAIKGVVAMAKECGVELMCLDTTKDGSPRHPLYLPEHLRLRPWTLNV